VVCGSVRNGGEGAGDDIRVAISSLGYSFDDNESLQLQYLPVLFIYVWLYHHVHHPLLIFQRDEGEALGGGWSLPCNDVASHSCATVCW